ncbi:hypothetical protein J8N05_18805 [Streptomyces sp. BH-SS-21]|uniref:Uncharacterized protein n=1 Tax=Streptomyces liliiviolaceus TaxID=2823109 RepID=A0A941BE64_9ACTN|nr:hypothetical protein [Streptomyces liliiviolaceus]MBQ0850244.1 hypothetical protein [Streptomyces liliiviolaceus]
MHERSPWGWFAWTVPGDGTLPEVPHHVGVLAPEATRTQRLALRWLTRCPARYVTWDTACVGARFSAAAIALVSVLAALFALDRGVPASVVLPAMLLAPLLAEYLPGRLDARAGEHVRSIEGESACRYLQRLASLHTLLVDAAAGSDRYELRRSVEIGHHLLWEAVCLLQAQDIRSASAHLIDCERVMLQLVGQVAQLLRRTRTEDATAATDRPCGNDGPAGGVPTFAADEDAAARLWTLTVNARDL